MKCFGTVNLTTVYSFKALHNYAVTNKTAKEELMKVANAAITNGSKLSCTGFEVNKATYENEGKIVMYFELTNKDKRRSPRIMMKIPVLTQQYFHLVDKKAREAAELIKLA